MTNSPVNKHIKERSQIFFLKNCNHEQKLSIKCRMDLILTSTIIRNYNNYSVNEKFEAFFFCYLKSFKKFTVLALLSAFNI